MEVLDTSGLKCPLPVLKAKKALKALSAGERLTGIATDPGAVKDSHHVGQATGDILESATEDDGVLTFVIHKARCGSFCRDREQRGESRWKGLPHDLVR